MKRQRGADLAADSFGARRGRRDGAGGRRG